MFSLCLNGFNCQWEACWCVCFLLFMVALRFLVGGMFVVFALSLRVIKRCADAGHAGTVLMARRILFVCRPKGLLVMSKDHKVHLRHPAYLSSLLSVTATS